MCACVHVSLNQCFVTNSKINHPLCAQSFLAFLGSCCHAHSERRRLEELSSVSTEEGKGQWEGLLAEVVGNRIDLLDLLNSFPSCEPPLSRLIGNYSSVYLHLTL